MRRFLLAAAAATVLLTASPASAATSEDQIRQLFEVMNTEEIYEAAIAETLQQQIASNPQMAPFADVMTDFFRQYAGFSVIEPELVRIYAETLTSKEVKALMKFYGSAPGQAYLQKMPRLTAAASQLGRDAVAANQDKLMEMIQGRVLELTAEQGGGLIGAGEEGGVEGGTYPDEGAVEPEQDATGE